MFKVVGLGTSYMGLNSILSGISFAVIEQPLHFSVNADGIDVPLQINFFLRRDASKGPALCQTSDIYDNQLTVTFYNPAGSGGSGLRHPISLVTVNGQSLSMMFSTESFIGAPFFKLNYEFFRSAPIAWEQML